MNESTVEVACEQKVAATSDYKKPVGLTLPLFKKMNRIFFMPECNKTIGFNVQPERVVFLQGYVFVNHLTIKYS